MKKKHAIFLFAALVCITAISQDYETYTVLKVSGENEPTIDGTIDPIWENVELAIIEKKTEMELPEPDPDADDISADFGLLWNDAGLFVRYKIVDDITIIFEDYDTDNDIDADQWWVDDFNSLMFSKDLINETFTSYEFAWQMGIDQEVKLSSDDWLNAALVATDLVESAWYNDGTTWILEAFISWECFQDGEADIYEGLEFQMDAGVSDDDDEIVGDSWNSRLQWSSTESGSVFTGIGWGHLTLSAEEIALDVSETSSNTGLVEIYPNPSNGQTMLRMNKFNNRPVSVSIYNISGQLIQEELFSATQTSSPEIKLNTENLTSGMYIIDVVSENQSELVKFVKQ